MGTVREGIVPDGSYRVRDGQLVEVQTASKCKVANSGNALGNVQLIQLNAVDNNLMGITKRIGADGAVCL